MRSMSGKLIDGWYGSIGGFYRVSDGVRDPQYPSDIGGQLTATLKHDLDGGSIMFWYRVLSDKNQWVADFPYIVSNGKAEPYPGFNQLNNTYNSKQLQNFLIPSPARRLLKMTTSATAAAPQLQLLRVESRFETRRRLVDQQQLPVRWRIRQHSCAGQQRQPADLGGFHCVHSTSACGIERRPRSRHITHNGAAGPAHQA